ncbi:MAG: terminase small subunit protein [Candidatus Paceibacterota bacterium]|jgi:hypothetical protein
MGRPSKYSDEYADLIIERICSGMSLSEICRDDEMPARSTVLLWVATDRESFSDRYAKACMARAYFWADELIDIADDSSNDYMTRQRDGENYEAVNPEAIARARLRVDTRKWLMCKLIPAYSDKVELGATGDVAAALMAWANKLPD